MDLREGHIISELSFCDSSYGCLLYSVHSEFPHRIKKATELTPHREIKFTSLYSKLTENIFVAVCCGEGWTGDTVQQSSPSISVSRAQVPCLCLRTPS